MQSSKVTYDHTVQTWGTITRLKYAHHRFDSQWSDWDSYNVMNKKQNNNITQKDTDFYPV